MVEIFSILNRFYEKPNSACFGPGVTLVFKLTASRDLKDGIKHYMEAK